MTYNLKQLFKSEDSKMSIEVRDEDECEMNSVDITTEEGKKQYLINAKEEFKQRYLKRKQSKEETKIREELDKQASDAAIKELGITNEEYDSVFEHYGFVEQKPKYAQLDDVSISNIIKRIKDIQTSQNLTINLLLDKEQHCDAHKRGTRNLLITDYLDMEQSKRTLLDILSSAYLESEGPLHTVNRRGRQFTDNSGE